MPSIQEIIEIAEKLQLRGHEKKKKIIIEQIDKLRQLQAEISEKELREAETELCSSWEGKARSLTSSWEGRERS